MHLSFVRMTFKHFKLLSGYNFKLTKKLQKYSIKNTHIPITQIHLLLNFTLSFIICALSLNTNGGVYSYTFFFLNHLRVSYTHF